MTETLEERKLLLIQSLANCLAWDDLLDFLNSETKILREELSKKNLCPHCKLHPLSDDPAVNLLSLDGKTMLCAMCGQIETLAKLDPPRAEELRIVLRKWQVATYGLDKHGNPKLPELKG